MPGNDQIVLRIPPALKDGWQIVREMTPEEIEAINKLCK